MTPEQIILLVLGVLLGIPALVLLILSIARARLHVQLLPSGVSISLCIGGFKIPLWGECKRPKNGRLKRCRRPRKVLRQEEQRTQRAIAKRYRKREKKRDKKVEKKQKKAKTPKLNLDDRLTLLGRFITICYLKTYGRMRIRVKAFRVWVGASNAAKTAILYGAVAQVVACVLDTANMYYATIQYDKKAVAVVPDFHSGRTSAEIDVVCSLSLLRWIMIYHSVTEDYNRAKYEVYKKAIERRKEELLAKQAARKAKK